MKDSKHQKKLRHYTGKAIADYNMIQKGDRVLVCVSGGKDSTTLLSILRLLQMRTNNKFELFALTVDQGQPGWEDATLHAWLTALKMPYEIIKRDTYSIVKEKIKPGKTSCSFCSRLRRGIIYRYAREHGFNKVALGHHREDLIVSLLMSIMYSGEIRSMPPKLLTDAEDLIVIRPLVYCQEADIAAYAKEQNFPILSCGFCSSQKNQMRKKVDALIKSIANENPKVPSNMLHALQNVQFTQLMDHDLQNFKRLEQKISGS